ncbi:MAG: ATP synthase subunit I, partial [Duodenibacillus sp.]|nr:ATP synthase subunit I [Duodenibacillus sp.]
LAGGACVAVPNTVYAFWLAAWQRSGRSKDHPAAVLGGEFLKMLVACIGFVLVAKFFAGVVWPAMISGIIAAVLSSLFLFFFYKY